jgi:hypothetical protein
MILGNRYCLDADAYAWQNDPSSRRGSTAGQFRGLKRRQFTGGAWGFTTAVTQFPDQKFTAICLSNTDQLVAWHMNKRLAELFLADKLEPQAPQTPATAASDLPVATVSESDLRDKVGAYRMKNTGAIWRITFENGALHLTDHLLKTHPLRPLSSSRFDPVGAWFYPTTQLVFARRQSESPKTDAEIVMTSEWNEPDSQGQLEFERIELVQLAATQLQDYAGEFFSDELACTYRLSVRDGQLWLRVNSRRWEPLDATVRDEFIPHVRNPFDGRTFTFLRNDQDEIQAISASYYRVNGIRFAKR